jgi:hypothetical protein
MCATIYTLKCLIILINFFLSNAVPEKFKCKWSFGAKRDGSGLFLYKKTSVNIWKWDMSSYNVYFCVINIQYI